MGIVLSPKDGDILAMPSLPTRDPNAPRDAMKKLTPNMAAQMEKDRATGIIYEPGSTLKTLTLAGALEKGVIKPDDSFFCGGKIKIRDKEIHDSHYDSSKAGHGYIPLTKILSESCNVCMAQIGVKMGAKNLFKSLDTFGLRESLELQLPTNASGVIKKQKQEDIFTDSIAARVAFGQSIATTPLHVAMSYGTIANNGTRVKPRLVLKKTQEGRVIQIWQCVNVLERDIYIEFNVVF